MDRWIVIYGYLWYVITTYMTCDRSQRTLKRHQRGRAQMQPHKIQSILGNNVGTWAPSSLASSVFFWRYCLYAPCIYENLYDTQMYHVCMGSLHQVSPASERHLMTLQTGQYAPAKILRYDPWAECNVDGRKWPPVEFCWDFEDRCSRCIVHWEEDIKLKTWHEF